MPSAKRERQRANREMGRQEAHIARRAARRKRSTRFTGILVGGLLAAALLLAFLVSRGGDDTPDTTPKTGANDGSSSAPALSLPTAEQLAAVTCSTDTPPAATHPTYAAAPLFTIDRSHVYTATLTTSCGNIVVQLNPRSAPVTTNNFVFLARQGFFNGTTFHRVVTDFVIQGGDPQGTGTGGPGYTFADETPLYDYRLGSLAMANGGPNSSGSQFFVCTTARATCGLEPKYNLLGQVTAGIDVAKKIESFSTGDGPPSQPVSLLSVTVVETDAKGQNVPEPITTPAITVATSAPVPTTATTASTATTGATGASTTVGATETTAQAGSTSTPSS